MYNQVSNFFTFAIRIEVNLKDFLSKRMNKSKVIVTKFIPHVIWI